MKKILFGLAIILISGGCALTKIFSVESPRPEPYQVTASKEVTTSTVEQVMKGQLGKQEGIEAVAIAALQAIEKAETQFQVAAITNVVANTANEIRRADGSAKLLSELSGGANKSIAEMSALEYMAYAGSQTAVAMGNREKAAEGLKAGFEWGKSQISTVAGAATGGGGLIALALGMLSRGKKIKNKDAVLRATGNAVNELAVHQPVAGAELKTLLARKTAKLPVNADEEFGIT